MTTKAKIIIAVLILAAGALGYYFLVYLPKYKNELITQVIKATGLDDTPKNRAYFETLTISELKQKLK